MTNKELLLEKIKNRPADWREGQAAWNCAIEVYGYNTVEGLRGTAFDPFHDDLRTELFLKEVETRSFSHKNRSLDPREDPLVTIPKSTFERLLTSEGILRQTQSMTTTDEYRLRAILMQVLAKVSRSGFKEEANKLMNAVDGYTQFMRNIDRTLIMKETETRPPRPPSVKVKNEK